MQILRGSGVPGNEILLQSANAQSALRRGTTGPSSESRRVNVALAVSREAGSAVPATPPRRIGNVVAFAAISLKRASTRPVMLEPSASLATGADKVSTLLAGSRS